MRKIIAKEVNPAHVDFRHYFDDDGLKGIDDENCTVYIVPADRRRYAGISSEIISGLRWRPSREPSIPANKNKGKEKEP